MEKVVFTLGYGHAPVRDVLRVLELLGADAVVDIRSIPFSRRRPEMNRPALERLLRGHGLAYYYLGEGLDGMPDGPGKPVVYFGNATCGVVPLSERPAFHRDIKRLLALLEQGRRPVLLCRCADPRRCHRARFVGVALVQRGLSVWHVDMGAFQRHAAEITTKEALLRRAALDGRSFAEALTTQKDLFGDTVIGRAL